MSEHAGLDAGLDAVPVRVGVVGAGPWATFVTAPVLAAGPETIVSGVWARRPDAARDLAQTIGTDAVATFDDLLERSDAIACSVPPHVQADYATRAAEAGKAVLLEKPLAVTVADARRIADAVQANGVASLVVFTTRFSQTARAFLEQAELFDPLGGRGCFLSGAFLGGPFSTSPWRHEHGTLLDVGPHMLDLVDAALGPIRSVAVAGDPDGWVSIQTEHDGGRSADVSVCCTAAIESRTELELFGRNGALILDGRADERDATFAQVRRDFAAIARSGNPHPVDAARGLWIQLVVDACFRALNSGRREPTRVR